MVLSLRLKTNWLRVSEGAVVTLFETKTTGIQLNKELQH